MTDENKKPENGFHIDDEDVDAMLGIIRHRDEEEHKHASTPALLPCRLPFHSQDRLLRRFLPLPKPAIPRRKLRPSRVRRRQDPLPVLFTPPLRRRPPLLRQTLPPEPAIGRQEDSRSLPFAVEQEKTPPGQELWILTRWIRKTPAAAVPNS